MALVYVCATATKEGRLSEVCAVATAPDVRFRVTMDTAGHDISCGRKDDAAVSLREGMTRFVCFIKRYKVQISHCLCK
jgi:hypothetical protein